MRIRLECCGYIADVGILDVIPPVRCPSCGVYAAGDILAPLLPSAFYLRIRDIVSYYLSRPVELVSELRMPSSWRVVEYDRAFRNQLIALESLVFQSKDNQYGIDTADVLARNFPSNFLLLVEGERVLAFIDLFFFEPDTFVDWIREYCKSMCELPTAADLANAKGMIATAKLQQCDNPVDVYIDAIAVAIDPDLGPNHKEGKMLKALLAGLVVHLMGKYSRVRINKISTIAVDNGKIYEFNRARFRTTAWGGENLASLAFMKPRFTVYNPNGHARIYFSTDGAFVSRLATPVVFCAKKLLGKPRSQYDEVEMSSRFRDSLRL
jgi:hypothetical protein